MSIWSHVRLPTPRHRHSAAAVATALAGFVLATWFADGFWIRRSYDWLFLLRPRVDIRQEKIVLVEMDTESEARFGQVPHAAWDRALHAELIQRLATQQVAAVAFDVVFSNGPGQETKGDRALRWASTNVPVPVLFGARLIVENDPSGRPMRRMERSFGESDSLDRAGLVETSFEPDGRMRRLFVGDPKLRTLAWRLHEMTSSRATGSPDDERWLNYYGPPDQNFPRVSFWRVLSNAVPPEIHWNDAVVFVGGRTLTGYAEGTGADFHSTPFGARATGLEVNALAYLNLRRGDWIRRWPRPVEIAIITLIGALAGWGSIGLTPRRAALALLVGNLAVVAVFSGTLGIFGSGRFLFPWLLVVAGVLPLAAAWAVFHEPSRDNRGVDSRVVPGNSTPKAVVERPRANPGGALLPLIPDHTMLRCIGRGAYGQVWLARSAIGTYHAVKVVYRSSFPNEDPFEREFRGIQVFAPISRHHPGWVHILHVGRNDAEGYFFYVMELGDDTRTGQEIDPARYQARSLASDRADRHRLPLADCIRVGTALADALDYLHSQLLVHRDIKPSNVIFLHGEPKFADIGTVTEMQNRERAVSCIGTPGFMAPEGPGTAVADLFSLGKLLYEIWTGCDRLAFPIVPETLAGEGSFPVHAEFQELLENLCRENPVKRPGSAAAVRATLQRMAIQ